MYRSLPAQTTPRLRVLALAAATDMGSNTPIEFLLRDSAIELMTLYVVPDVEIPAPLPDHDVAIVIASDSEDCRDALDRIDRMAPRWPRPLLNPPRLVGRLDRDRLHRLLDGLDGVEIPATDRRFARAIAGAGAFDARDFRYRGRAGISHLSCRPRGSHAGAGLARIDDRAALPALSRSAARDGIFRRALRQLRRRRRPVPQIPHRVRRRPRLRLPHGDRGSLGHLVSQRRHVAERRQASRRRNFHARLRRRLCAPPSGRTSRHRRNGSAWIILRSIARKPADGSLLVFEADNTAIVHDMDPADIFPYKPPQMRKIFDAFAAMLVAAPRAQQERAA